MLFILRCQSRWLLVAMVHCSGHQGVQWFLPNNIIFRKLYTDVWNSYSSFIFLDMSKHKDKKFLLSKTLPAALRLLLTARAVASIKIIVPKLWQCLLFWTLILFKREFYQNYVTRIVRTTARKTVTPLWKCLGTVKAIGWSRQTM